jgi:hypothetical protein
MSQTAELFRAGLDRAVDDGRRGHWPYVAVVRSANGEVVSYRDYRAPAAA